MSATEFLEKIEQIAEASSRYRTQAFFFVLRSLEHCRQRLGREGHVTGRELAEAARDLAIGEYGPMAKTVLNDWGIRSTEDLGRIVYLLIDHEILGKTEEDSLDDFREVFDFDAAFVRDYRW